jgi:uncharacterized protein (TIGR00369 family)
MLQGLMTKFFGSMSPHMRKLGFEIISIESGVCEARLPYSDDLIGDPTRGVLHGGVVTTLLDTAGGAAVLAALRKPISLATLDLRIDYLRSSRPRHDLLAKVECYKTTYNVAFARGVAHEGDERDTVAAMAATYMLRTLSFRRAVQP